MMTRLPLRVRLTLVTAVFASVTTCVLGLALYRMLEGSLLREVDGRVTESAHQMRELIAQTPAGRPRRRPCRPVPTATYACSSHRLPTRRDEIHQLSATINDLVGAVQRTLHQQRQFLAFTSHELRSPLTVILANLSWNILRRPMAAA